MQEQISAMVKEQMSAMMQGDPRTDAGGVKDTDVREDPSTGAWGIPKLVQEEISA